MTTTTLKVDATDSHDTVTIQAGGSAGTKGLNVVIDNSKLTNQAAVSLALRKAADAVDAQWPLPAS